MKLSIHKLFIAYTVKNVFIWTKSVRSPKPINPKHGTPVVKSSIQTGATVATNWYLQNSGTAYDQQNKTANRAVQVSTTLMIASLAVSAAGPEAAPLSLALDMASNIAGMVGYGMELHDALKSHNKKMETEAIIGIVASGIGAGFAVKDITKGYELVSRLSPSKIVETIGSKYIDRVASKMEKPLQLSEDELKDRSFLLSRGSTKYAEKARERSLQYAEDIERGYVKEGIYLHQAGAYRTGKEVRPQGEELEKKTLQELMRDHPKAAEAFTRDYHVTSRESFVEDTLKEKKEIQNKAIQGFKSGRQEALHRVTGTLTRIENKISPVINVLDKITTVPKAVQFGLKLGRATAPFIKNAFARRKR
jgi:hypothetical protein